MDNNVEARVALYLPVEIKAREFNSKIFLALIAASKGFRVYIGSKHAVDRLLTAPQRLAGGIYFYKSGNLRGRFEAIYSKCESLVVLDEEMGVAVKDIEFYYQQRVNIPEAIARYFVISDRHCRVVSSINPELAGNVRVTGWPRVDLWRPELSSFYAKEVEKIKALHPKYLLFSSDFGFIDERRIADETSRLQAVGTAKDAIEQLEQKWRAALASYKEFVIFLKDFDEANHSYHIIVRPHPAENHAQWHADLGGLSNVTVIYEGEIGPWLLASEGLLHRGCTTAVQAYISKKPSIYWHLDGAPDIREDMLPFKLSTRVRSLQEFHEVCDDLSLGRYLAPPPPDDLDYELYIGEQFAVEIIVDELLSLGVSPESRSIPSRAGRIIDRVRGAARDVRLKLGLTKSKILRDQYLRKLPGGITAQEVSGVLERFPIHGSVKIRQVMHNLVEIESE